MQVESSESSDEEASGMAVGQPGELPPSDSSEEESDEQEPEVCLFLIESSTYHKADQSSKAKRN